MAAQCGGKNTIQMTKSDSNLFISISTLLYFTPVTHCNTDVLQLVERASRSSTSAWFVDTTAGL